MMMVFVQKALEMLDATGAKYKVVMPDGTEFGELILAAPEQKKKRKFKHIYQPYIERLLAGDRYAEIPFGDAEGELLASAIGAACCNQIGAGTCTVKTLTDQKVVAVLRFRDPIQAAPANDSDDEDEGDLLSACGNE